MNIDLKLFLVFAVTASATPYYNPCQNVRHGDEHYLLPDPLNCSKFYMCQGRRPHHMDCAAGTSFNPNWQPGFGACTGPDPRQVSNHCYFDEDNDKDLNNININDNDRVDRDVEEDDDDGCDEWSE